ncbi:hypothetical protein [Lysobacter sp. F6437]|uniref:hypothetical protein n=1 Tax=Lysobacter sp. F6437 TaxID=3459296 RepID=UPI00403DCC3D
MTGSTDNKALAFGAAIGLALGAGVGVVFDNIALGAGVGLVIGVVFGLMRSRRKR